MSKNFLYDQNKVIEEAVVREFSTALRESDFIGGASVVSFEENFAAFCDVEFAAGTSSGTSALELALRALGLEKEDEVILPTNTFFATAAAVVRCGATPVFCDIEPNSLLLSLEDAARRITGKTRALIAVHLFGRVCNMDEVVGFCNNYGLRMIEDASQAHGAKWAGRSVGSFGDAGCFSFYPGKNLGAFGDAGIVVSSSDAIISKIKSLRDHGRDADARDRHLAVGSTDRMDAIQARVLSVKLPYLPDWNRRRKVILDVYKRHIAQPPAYLFEDSPKSAPAVHQVVIQIHHRDRLLNDLRRIGVSATVHYPIPCHMQPAIRPWSEHISLPVAEEAARRILSLPLSPAMTDDDVLRIAGVFNKLVKVAAR
jgi:dTDP-4-amino-4,6-dideoxygalactose transaminase